MGRSGLGRRLALLSRKGERGGEALGCTALEMADPFVHTVSPEPRKAPSRVFGQSRRENAAQRIERKEERAEKGGGNRQRQ